MTKIIVEHGNSAETFENLRHMNLENDIVVFGCNNDGEVRVEVRHFEDEQYRLIIETEDA